LCSLEIATFVKECTRLSGQDAISLSCCLRSTHWSPVNIQQMQTMQYYRPLRIEVRCQFFAERGISARRRDPHFRQQARRWIDPCSPVCFTNWVRSKFPHNLILSLNRPSATMQPASKRTTYQRHKILVSLLAIQGGDTNDSSPYIAR
jgi:hypothetical protein